MSLRRLSGRFGLQCIGPVEVPPNGIVMDASSNGHKEVPDGVGEGDAAITFEEDHAQAVENPAGHQLWEAIPVGLREKHRDSMVTTSNMSEPRPTPTPPYGQQLSFAQMLSIQWSMESSSFGNGHGHMRYVQGTRIAMEPHHL